MELISVEDFYFDAASDNSITYVSGRIVVLIDGKEKEIDFAGNYFECLKSTQKINEVFGETDLNLWTLEKWFYTPIRGEYKATMPVTQKYYLELVKGAELSTNAKLQFDTEHNVECSVYALDFFNALSIVYPERVKDVE